MQRVAEKRRVDLYIGAHYGAHMSKHPGVWILRPSGRHGFRIKWIDPDSGKARRSTLPAKCQGATKAAEKAREAAAIRKSNEVHRRRGQLEGGAQVRSETPLAEAEQIFWTHLRDKGKAERTFETYAIGVAAFMDWAAKHRIRTTDDVTRGVLSDFDDHLSALGGAASTHNKNQRAIKRMVRVWILKDLCARITFDDLKRIEPKEVVLDRREWLTPSQCQNMLDAALRHDDDTDAPGTPIAPFVMYSLLGGARVSEMLGLDWSHVDMDALDINGETVGAITVTRSVSKTKREREISFRETPSLRRLFAAMQLRSGKSSGLVWEYSRMAVKRSRGRMSAEFGSPAFTFQQLRITSDCYLNCSPGIYGTTAAFMAAQRLGHSVAISEKFYASAVRGIKPEHRTLEAVLGIEKQCDQIINAAASHGRASVFRIARST